MDIESGKRVSHSGKESKSRSALTGSMSSGSRMGRPIEEILRDGGEMVDEHSTVSGNSFTEQQERVGRMDSRLPFQKRKDNNELFESEEENAIARYVRHCLFVELKFVNSDMQLYARGVNTISRHVMDELQIDRCERNAWWKKYAPLVKGTLDQKRSNVSSEIGKRFMSKLVLKMHLHQLCSDDCANEFLCVHCSMFIRAMQSIGEQVPK